MEAFSTNEDDELAVESALDEDIAPEEEDPSSLLEDEPSEQAENRIAAVAKHNADFIFVITDPGKENVS
jgi:hypothetical protein